MQWDKINVTNHNDADAIETLGLVLISGNNLQILSQRMLRDIGQDKIMVKRA
jgi:hypothetical protein